MTDDYTYIYGRYLIDCSPQPAQSGGFQAQAVAICSRAGKTVRALIPVPAESPFPSEQDAVQFSLKVGMDWADSKR